MTFVSDCINRLEEYIAEQQCIHHGDKLLLGISGGADSAALLYLFSRLRYTHRLSLLAVHINHQLRGAESDADEELVKEICRSLSIPLIIRRINLGDQSDLENRARNIRFKEFHQLLAGYRFHKIVLGHHRQDLAETVLMNLMRGAGLGGLAGIKPTQGKVVHPLLCFDPTDLRKILQEAKIPWREDSSNLSLQFTRNRIRNQLLPSLIKDYNPNVIDKLVEEANILNQADQYIREKASKRMKKLILEQNPGSLILSIPELNKIPAIEQYYVLRLAFSLISGTETDFLSVHYQDIIHITRSEGSKYISLPLGIFAKKQYQELIFTTKAEDIAPNVAETLLVDSDRSRAVHMNYRFTFKYLKVLPPHVDSNDKYCIILDLDQINSKFYIRSRQAGDRFIPLGMNNFKKLKDFFIDEKVPKYDRDLIPIFDDGEKLFWICGQRMDNRVRYTETTTRYLMIKAEKISVKPNRAANRKKRGYDEFDEL